MDHYTQKPFNAVVTKQDKQILQDLGKRIAEVGTLPIQQQRIEMWSQLNQLNIVKPMIWINEICWNEMAVDNELDLLTSSEFCKRIESELRQTLYLWEHLQLDMVVEPIVYSPIVVHNTGIGLVIKEDIVKVDEDNVVVSHRYHNQLKNEDSIEKISMPKIFYDKNATNENYHAYCDIFNGVLAVEQRGAPGFWFAPWDDLITLMGAEEALTQLALQPNFIHKAIDRIVTEYLHVLDQYEEQSLLALNNKNVRIGSGAYGYTSELPKSDYDPEHIRAIDMWGAAAAQIFSEVSPEMHEEFAISYERKWLERFGQTYYGCCEPLAKKVDKLKNIRNLRKISVSPWNNLEEMAEKIGSDFVFSLKPNPSIFAGELWNLQAARDELDKALKIARRYKCQVEIIMKDISTVHYEPQRLWDWAKMASEITSA
jgi:hypothetical protein